MKKILALTLALVLALACFAACSKTPEAPTGKKLVILEEPLTAEPYGFATKLGNDSLIQAINAATQELVADGTVKALFDKYNAPYTAPAAPEATQAKAATDDSLQKVKDAGKLVIATSPDFPPFEELQDDGTVVGIEIDVLNKICEKLGVELEIQQMDFDSVLPGVQAGKFDLGVSGITATEERKENALFTDPYCMSAIAIVVPEGSDIKGKDDLSGKTISCQSGTTADTFCRANGYTVSSFQANSDAQMALTSGKVDAWVIDDLTAKEMVDAYNAGV